MAPPTAHSVSHLTHYSMLAQLHVLLAHPTAPSAPHQDNVYPISSAQPVPLIIQQANNVSAHQLILIIMEQLVCPATCPASGTQLLWHVNPAPTAPSSTSTPPNASNVQPMPPLLWVSNAQHAMPLRTTIPLSNNALTATMEKYTTLPQANASVPLPHPCTKMDHVFPALL